MGVNGFLGVIMNQNHGGVQVHDVAWGFANAKAETGVPATSGCRPPKARRSSREACPGVMHTEWPSGNPGQGYPLQLVLPSAGNTDPLPVTHLTGAAV
jgi:hypothetical protein